MKRYYLFVFVVFLLLIAGWVITIPPYSIPIETNEGDYSQITNTSNVSVDIEITSGNWTEVTDNFTDNISYEWKFKMIPTEFPE